MNLKKKEYSKEEIDDIVAQSFLEDFQGEIDSEEESLDVMYTWTKGSFEKSDAGHFVVTSNEYIEKLPTGATYNLTKRQIRVLNDEWNARNRKN